MLELLMLLLLPHGETTNQPSVLAVRNPAGPVEKLHAWAEYTGKGFVPAATHLREDGGWEVYLPSTPVPPHTLWVRGKGTAFVAIPWPASQKVQLPSAGNLQLTVHSSDPRHGLPTSLAVRLLWRPSPDTQPREVPAQAYTLRWNATDGSLRIGGLPFGPGHSYDLELSSSGWVPTQVTRIDLESAERKVGRVELHPAGRLCGRVEIPGEVAEGEKVVVELRWGEHRRRMHPEAGGSFCFSDAPVGALATVQALSRFRASLPVEVIPPAENLELALPPLEMLAGEVVTEDHTPVKDCRLSIALDPGISPPAELSSQLSTLRVETSCQGGQFRCARPWPGEALLLEVTAPPWAPARLSVPAGSAAEDLRVVLSAGHRVEGRVYDAEGGAGVEGAKVSLVCPDGVPVASFTDQEGNFTLSGVAPGGACQGRVEHPDFPAVSQTVHVAADDTRWEVSLRRGVRVRGLVLAAPRGEPVAGALVLIFRLDGTRHTVTSDNQGRFLSPPLASGTWMIRAEREGAVAATAELTITAPVQPPPVTLWLEEGLEVWGTVEGLTPPASGAVVTLIGGGGRYTRTTTGYGGTFRARGVLPGRVGFTVRHPSLPEPCTGAVWISADSPGPVKLACTPPSVTLHVLLRQASGEPAPSAILLVKGSDASFRNYLCEVKNGQGHIEVVPGTYRIEYYAAASREFMLLWQGPILSDRNLELALPAASH